MPLVDYSSDSSEPEGSQQVKKRKLSHTTTPNNTNKTTKETSELPPLPPAFHDLYASTVRVSASDDPALHQGRKRVNPHKVGNWPSHVYIEWHPTQTQRTLLTNLLSHLTSSSTPSTTKPITSFLTSDLGAPQPLHISLSRPIVLTTSQKDDFLTNLESSIRGSGIRPFELLPQGLEWHRTDESARSFLVLRVSSAADEEMISNPQLSTLLQQSNSVVTSFGQPALYGGEDNTNTNVNTAFHISIAWSFALPDSTLLRVTEEVFNSSSGSSSSSSSVNNGRSMRDEVCAMRLRVDGVKVKIGNVVTNIPLPDARSRVGTGGSIIGGGL
ncbi:U6 snRNA phosphodiesterase Usb1 [Poronia punctata]|nr:U6 snRNA phosphodiesterase Usb1 [Poronia punctata]